MQTAVLPVTTCDAIDKLIRNFVWGSSDEARKVHLVSWEHICKPKEEGGLGLKMARALNQAYMMKLAFMFFQEPDKLWVQVLQGKYMKETESGLAPRNLTSQSAVWKGLTREWQNMLLGARSAIRDGRGTSFWTARWLDSGDRLIDSFTGRVEDIDLSAPVAEFVNEDGQWDVDDCPSFYLMPRSLQSWECPHLEKTVERMIGYGAAKVTGHFPSNRLTALFVALFPAAVMKCGVRSGAGRGRIGSVASSGWPFRTSYLRILVGSGDI
ncbi:Putative ribonuclease H protein At1g65750 [Linum perenne]